MPEDHGVKGVPRRAYKLNETFAMLGLSESQGATLVREKKIAADRLLAIQQRHALPVGAARSRRTFVRFVASWRAAGKLRARATVFPHFGQGYMHRGARIFARRRRSLGREALAEFSRKMMAGEVVSGPEACRR